jgi:transposase
LIEISRIFQSENTSYPINSVYERLCAVKKIAELGKLHRSLCDKRQSHRVKTVIALSEGWSIKKVHRSTKIKFIFLPSYLPNLNLIEQYWKFFKKKTLNNRYYETLGEFKRACESFS